MKHPVSLLVRALGLHIVLDLGQGGGGWICFDGRLDFSRSPG